MRRSAILRTIEEAIERPETRAAFDELRERFAVADALPKATPEHHAATARLVEQVHAVGAMVDPDGRLPSRSVAFHLVNLAVLEMLPAHPYGIAQPQLAVPLPSGRLRGSRTPGRAAVISRLRNDPGMVDAAVEAAGRELDPDAWPEPGHDDYDSRRKRIARLRTDAGR